MEVDLVLNSSEGEFKYFGTMDIEEDKVTLNYSEKIDDFFQEVIVKIDHISERVSIDRSVGNIIFIEGERTEFRYITDYGSVFFDVFTSSLEIDEVGFRVEYELYNEGDLVNSENIVVEYKRVGE